ncbi:MAG: RNA polymerase sigma-70 factor [Mediterranea sp.]|jgi:RNA polymerase sigma-70 factor (ECF subfamily)|nr:RNA polymerase sigma-70 factor [Mediterranea sp.]
MNDDILLMNSIRKGDEKAYKMLFEHWFTPLCRFIYYYLDNQLEAEETALDIFLYLWENREHLEIKISLKAYLFRSARNRCLNVLRNRKQFVELDSVHIQNASVKNTDILEYEDLNNLVAEAITHLPDKCRTVFLKSRRDNMSNPEIAEDLGIALKTVEGHINKALKAIKQHLGENYWYMF